MSNVLAGINDILFCVFFNIIYLGFHFVDCYMWLTVTGDVDVDGRPAAANLPFKYGLEVTLYNNIVYIFIFVV